MKNCLPFTLQLLLFLPVVGFGQSYCWTLHNLNCESSITLGYWGATAWHGNAYASPGGTVTIAPSGYVQVCIQNNAPGESLAGVLTLGGNVNYGSDVSVIDVGTRCSAPSPLTNALYVDFYVLNVSCLPTNISFSTYVQEIPGNEFTPLKSYVVGGRVTARYRVHVPFPTGYLSLTVYLNGVTYYFPAGYGLNQIFLGVPCSDPVPPHAVPVFVRCWSNGVPVHRLWKLIEK